MKVLITGANGQLGYDISKELKSRNIDTVETDIKDFDLTDERETLSYIKKSNPDVVVHCAAYTAVDNAEDEEKQCMLVNGKGTKNVAKSCEEISAKMVYISTDYVFDGAGEVGYETNHQTGPLNVYGKSKLEGENAVKSICSKYFIVRTSWVFGLNGNNFVTTMIKLAKDRDSIRVVDDQVGSPTYTKDLTRLICNMIQTDKYGVYHATNEGVCTFADFAKEIIRQSGVECVVNSITTEEFGAKAKRPKNSRLSKQCLLDNGFEKLPHWEDALKRFIKELNS